MIQTPGGNRCMWGRSHCHYNNCFSSNNKTTHILNKRRRWQVYTTSSESKYCCRSRDPEIQSGNQEQSQVQWNDFNSEECILYLINVAGSWFDRMRIFWFVKLLPHFFFKKPDWICGFQWNRLDKLWWSWAIVGKRLRDEAPLVKTIHREAPATETGRTVNCIKRQPLRSCTVWHHVSEMRSDHGQLLLHSC